MSLTARPIKLIGVTQKQLRSMGIEFAKSTASNKVISMKGKGPSRFDGGILFAGPDNNKGDLLVDFLSKVKLKPKKVVFVDNKIHHVENVEKALAGMKIEYVGCRHGAADKKIAGFRREIADLQHKYFRQIMPDSTADTFLRIEAK